MEHRLFGADTDSCRKYKSGPRTWQWNAIERVPAPDTLLGPEGFGRKLEPQAGRSARTLPTDEPPHGAVEQLPRGRHRHGEGAARTLRTTQWTRASL